MKIWRFENLKMKYEYNGTLITLMKQVNTDLKQVIEAIMINHDYLRNQRSISLSSVLLITNN